MESKKNRVQRERGGTPNMGSAPMSFCVCANLLVVNEIR